MTPIRSKMEEVSQTTEQLRTRARALLESGEVKVIIGYTSRRADLAVPFFATKPEQCDRLVFDERCVVNLTNYLHKPEVKALGRPAIVSKGCDNAALAILIQEGRVKREDVHILGVECWGMDKSVCAYCDQHEPALSDDLIKSTMTAEQTPPSPAESMTPEERWKFWMGEFERCIRCYACREVCPTCYCPQCVVERNQPQTIDTSPTPRGNLMWHLMRAMHHAGRCAQCGECERACPMDIPLMDFMRSMHDTVRDRFAADVPPRPGESPSPLSRYREDDKEEFFG